MLREGNNSPWCYNKAVLPPLLLLFYFLFQIHF